MRSENRHRPAIATRSLLLLAGIACSGGKGGELSLSGDIPGLDTVAARGDSLIARTERGDLARELIGDSQPGRGAPNAAPDSPPPAAPPSAPPAAAATSTPAPPVTLSGGDLRGAPPVVPTPAVRGDTVRGVLVAAPPGSSLRVALQLDGKVITLSGMGTSPLSALEGVEVLLRGVRIGPRDFVVTDFVVRGWNGFPVVDGVIQPDGTLQPIDGSPPVRALLPPSLKGRAGLRVWIALRNGAPVRYELIAR